MGFLPFAYILPTAEEKRREEKKDRQTEKNATPAAGHVISRANCARILLAPGGLLIAGGNQSRPVSPLLRPDPGRLDQEQQEQQERSQSGSWMPKVCAWHAGATVRAMIARPLGIGGRAGLSLGIAALVEAWRSNSQSHTCNARVVESKVCAAASLGPSSTRAIAIGSTGFD